MAFKKLKFSEQDIREIKAYREKLKVKELDSSKLSKIIGGCGGTCEVTCSYYCQPVCVAACETSCVSSCEDTCRGGHRGSPHCNDCAHTVFAPYPI